MLGVRLYFSSCLWQSELVRASLKASAGTSIFSSRRNPTIFPLMLRCFRKNAIPASRSWKKLPSTLWLSINSSLFVPRKRANRNCRFEATQRLGYLPLRVVSNLLSENLERLWSNAEYEPTASTVKERTRRVHPILQLTCSLFQLQMYVLVVGNKPFKFLYVHSPFISFSFSPEERHHTVLR